MNKIKGINFDLNLHFMPYKDLLEEYPLYRKYRIEVPSTLYELPVVPINMHCECCNSNQTFTMGKEYKNSFGNIATANSTLTLRYICQSCKLFIREFLIHIDERLEFIYKAGQYPAIEIKTDRDFEKLLGKHFQLYHKGLICESHGFGIAAFSYYRRIIDDIIDEMLDSILTFIDNQNLEEYKEALLKTKSTKVTQHKIELVKHLLPSILKPDGLNPLDILHSELSGGLHSQTDEECLDIAIHIREILTFMVNQILISKKSALDFTKSMKELGSKKQK